MITNMSSQDDPNRRSTFENFGRKMDQELGDAAQRLEQESERLIAYINNELVPAIRSKSSKALRTTAEQLHKLAEKMEKQRQNQGQG
jgi:hypothetical protein